MAKQVEFFFDVGSPASYLAWTQLPGICAQTGAVLVYRPMLLGGVFQATGNASPATIPAKGRYSTRDFDRFARRYRVELVQNPHFPIITLTLMRAVVGIQLRQPDRLPDFLRTVFRAIWVESLNLNEPGLVAGALEAGGFDATEVMALTAEPEVKSALRANTEDAIARGAFGAPSMFVDGELYFGQDRLDFVREALAA